jgi:epoxide hydrolase-like predicted phosphatase
MIKALCSDFGGVLFSNYLYEERLDSEKLRAYKQIVIDIYNQREKEITKGTYTTRNFKNDLLSLNNSFPKNHLELVYKDITKINSQLVNLYYSLNKKITVCGLVNEASKWTELRVYFHHLKDLFSNIYVSSYIGYRKPDKEAYRVMLEGEQLNPEEVIFIDDRGENINSAKEMGFHTIKYESFEQTQHIFNQLITQIR